KILTGLSHHLLFFGKFFRDKYIFSGRFTNEKFAALYRTAMVSFHRMFLLIVRYVYGLLQQLHHSRDSLSAANTSGDDAVPAISSSQFIDKLNSELGTSTSQRMT